MSSFTQQNLVRLINLLENALIELGAYKEALAGLSDDPEALVQPLREKQRASAAEKVKMFYDAAGLAPSEFVKSHSGSQSARPKSGKQDS